MKKNNYKKVLGGLLALVFVFSAGYGQMAVKSDGKIVVSDNSATPRAQFDIPKNTTTETTSQFGTFGIQSFAPGNGFLLANGFWNGSALQAYANGAVNLIQFNSNKARFRTTPSISAGGTTLDLQENITFVHGGVTGGIVGINTFTPSGFNLYVEGTAFKSDGNSSWDIVSDKRLKKNIKSYGNGLDVINNMNIVEYEYNGKAGTKSGRKHIGIVAQEMKKVAPFMVSEFEHQEYIGEKGIDEDPSLVRKETYLSYNDSALPYLLVNAVKEQQEIIENLIRRIDELENSNSSSNSISNSITLEEFEDSKIMQNRPNPFTSATSIDYIIPMDARSAAIEFFNTSGILIKTVNIDSRGEGVLDVNNENLQSGVYSYRLIVDKKVVETHQMIVQR